jgi:CheY-like chemotaxis protein
MARSRAQPLIAVLNSSEDLLALLCRWLEGEGFDTVCETIEDLTAWRLDLPSFLAEHRPDLVVYDIAPPYEENWRVLTRLRETDALRDRRLVITTTNRAMLEWLVGPTDALEVVGKPYDPSELTEAVRRALGDEPPGTSPGPAGPPRTKPDPGGPG